MKALSDDVFSRLKLHLESLLARLPEVKPFQLGFPGAKPLRLGGNGDPAFTITCRNQAGAAAILSSDETAIAQAYIGGAIDLEGDMIELYRLRNGLADRHPLWRWWFVHLQPFLFGQIRCDKKWIAKHYDYDRDFYLLFLDKKCRAYSQAVYDNDDEPLETAMERKLKLALDSCRVNPGARVLDIGGGWGAFLEYAGQRGIHVTSITISEQSELFLKELAADRGLDCTILRQHFYEHSADQPYDAIVNLGVTEHLPDYHRSMAHYARLVKPGGRVYIDASAARAKYDFSSFIFRFIYPGNPTPMCLEEYLAAVERSPFELLELYNDRKNYELTARRWAENLDASRDEIVRRWGEELYRKFRLYLWGTAHAFHSRLMSAYRLVLEMPQDASCSPRWKI